MTRILHYIHAGNVYFCFDSNTLEVFFFKIHLHLKALFTELKKCTELLFVVQLFSTEAIGVQIIRECMGMKGICP